MWLAAWKHVSNDAKRTISPPNAKHSTLLQGCFFMFLFLIPTTIPATMYNHCHSNFPLSPNGRFWITYCYPTTLPNNSNGVASVISTW